MSAATDEPDLPPGTMLGRYRLDRLVGAGGMGAVYLAVHTGLNKTVIVKVLHPHYARSAEVRLRFVREGEAAARIRHAHVVDVTDVGVEGSIPYLVMEYLQGESLGALIGRHGALSPDRAVDLMLPIIDAVRAAHLAGVVHRDLKPDNLFIVRTPTGDPHPKVLDFGISRVLESDGAAQLTGTAAILGTPAYMSPEQIVSSRDADAGSDQYALGVILYECLTGTPAFEGDGVYAVLSRVGEGRFDPPRSRRPELDPALEAVVLRAMAHRREWRYRSLQELGTALLPFASPRARMIWGTTFHPPDDHGPADTRLEMSSAPPSAAHADTFFHGAQERDSTTLPVRAGRSSAPRLVAVAVALTALSAASFVALRWAGSARSATPAPATAALAPTVTAIALPVVARPAQAPPPVGAVEPARVDAGVTQVLAAPIASADAGVVEAESVATPPPHRPRRRRRVPYLPP